MSAECSECGCDLVYPPGMWPIGECPACPRPGEIRLSAEQVEKLRAAMSIVPPSNLRLLAEWHDAYDSSRPGRGTEVQRDLRLAADAIDAALALLDGKERA